MSAASNRGSGLLEAAEVRILRLQPGDEIILSIKDGRRVTPEILDELRKQAEERWPGYRVTTLGNVDMEVVRKEDESGL